MVGSIGDSPFKPGRRPAADGIKPDTWDLPEKVKPDVSAQLAFSLLFRVYLQYCSEKGWVSLL
jgi:hypothetical protein